VESKGFDPKGFEGATKEAIGRLIGLLG